MKEEKERILAQASGYGEYRFEMMRARHLTSAIQTLRDPDWIYRPRYLETAELALIREYNIRKYNLRFDPFTVVLVGRSQNRPQANLWTPYTSFPSRRNVVRNKWMGGELVYAKNAAATA